MSKTKVEMALAKIRAAQQCHPNAVMALVCEADALMEEALAEQEPEANAVIAEVVGCFDAAYAEGLQEALEETTDERLKDLVERRLLHALYAAQKYHPAPANQPSVPLETGHPVIALGFGKVEVAEGWQEGVPALIFGRNGTGVIGEPTQPDRVHLNGETLAVVTFANIESLDVVAATLSKIKAARFHAAPEAHVSAVHKEILTTVDNAPEAPEPAQWQKMSDQPPPPESNILVVWGSHQAVDKAHTFSKWKHPTWPLGYLIQGHPGSHNDVTHWMLLPTPPVDDAALRAKNGGGK